MISLNKTFFKTRFETMTQLTCGSVAILWHFLEQHLLFLLLFPVMDIVFV